jgi:hypothetical protein
MAATLLSGREAFSIRSELSCGFDGPVHENRLPPNPVGQVRDARSIDDTDDFERNAVEVTIVKQPNTGPEKDRDDTNDQFVQQSGPQALLHHARSHQDNS